VIFIVDKITTRKLEAFLTGDWLLINTYLSKISEMNSGYLQDK